MATGRVLVAFASEHGSTAGIAEVIAASLRQAGLDVDCRASATVGNLDPYRAVVLGSGVYLGRRLSDGQGFLPRHRDKLEERPIWLFAAGPIGSSRTDPGVAADRPESAAVDPAEEATGDQEALDPDCPLALVARAFGARGFASFGICRPATGLAAPVARDASPDLRRVRRWAAAIAADLRGARPVAFVT